MSYWLAGGIRLLQDREKPSQAKPTRVVSPWGAAAARGSGWGVGAGVGPQPAGTMNDEREMHQRICNGRGAF